MPKILICDDEAPLRMLVAGSLANRDYELEEASDGEEALRLARELHPDLMIVDWMMPGLNGLDVLTQLRTDPAFADMPAIMLTARSQTVDRDAAADAGADRFITKPFSPLKLAGVVDDLLRRRLMAQNNRLRELDRLKDDFVALVSHELRTPLTSIGGYVELVLDEEAGPLTADQRYCLAIVKRNSERLLRLVGELLFLAQVEAHKLELEYETVDISALATECVEAAKPSAKRKMLDLQFQASDVPAFRADPGRLTQLIGNLVSNALKFTASGGCVMVRATAGDGCAVVEVQDSGMGISAEDQAQLFQPFFRAANAGEQDVRGTGLGLVVTKSIVEAHGGRISLESTEGVGTTFRITLPLDSPTPDINPQRGQVAAGSAHLLLAADLHGRDPRSGGGTPAGGGRSQRRVHRGDPGGRLPHRPDPGFR